MPQMYIHWSCMDIGQIKVLTCEIRVQWRGCFTTELTTVYSIIKGMHIFVYSVELVSFAIFTRPSLQSNICKAIFNLRLFCHLFF